MRRCNTKQRGCWIVRECSALNTELLPVLCNPHWQSLCHHVSAEADLRPAELVSTRSPAGACTDAQKPLRHRLPSGDRKSAHNISVNGMAHKEAS
eukprot:3488990-Prymnesium_polylepis.2